MVTLCARQEQRHVGEVVDVDNNKFNMSAPSEPTQESLTAAYKSPSGTKQFHYAIENPHVDKQLDTTSQTSYLSQLRASTKKLQEDINYFLTEKMDEDKKIGLGAMVRSKTKEELEEENYGEEIADDDDNDGTG
ncbi:uncharacterized protein A1O9_06047 [Exophiala aquamarina CBS 119918]|uniref:EKC/KEOPS complex subunit GON7 n=1 Tax=Exophiala aquamarina CBS 119918 TaxID=1182545 RepID=A0A072PDD4_9EURO|nr:uncharacterized protein A1O9_06047 [Exophiala aquamarina CBS 119918]KEF58124.1 hypothetical protein A1O9_06047 [Exophiala aquamarina CBS 119918]